MRNIHPLDTTGMLMFMQLNTSPSVPDTNERIIEGVGGEKKNRDCRRARWQ